MKISYIGVDVGGTFTDAVGMAVDGMIGRARRPPPRSAHVDGILNRSNGSPRPPGRSPRGLLVRRGDGVGRNHGVTNAIAQMEGRRTGLLVTKGFRDTLRIARSPRIPTVDPFVQAPMPELIPRSLIAEIDERVDVDGDVVVAARRGAGAPEVGRLVEDEGIEALAVCYLWSFLNPAQRGADAGDTSAEEFPDLFLSVSSELYPVMREYERMVTTCLNAFVSEAVTSYVEELDAG